MVGVGRDLCGSSSPTPLPKQGHLQQAEQDHVQAGLQYLHRRRKLGREEPDEVQQGQVQGPAPGEEQPHASVQAWGGTAALCKLTTTGKGTNVREQYDK